MTSAIVGQDERWRRDFFEKLFFLSQRETKEKEGWEGGEKLHNIHRYFRCRRDISIIEIALNFFPVALCFLQNYYIIVILFQHFIFFYNLKYIKHKLKMNSTFRYVLII